MTSHDPFDDHLDGLEGEPELADVLAALAEDEARPPAADARARLRATVAGRPRPTAEPLPAPALYARRVADLEAVLDRLRGPDWSAPAAPYTWTVHGLVAHLAVIEEHTLRQLGLGAEPPVAAGAEGFTDHLGLGADVVAALLAGPPAATVERWRAAARRVVEHVTGPSFDERAPLPLHDWPFSAGTALVVRAFELWTHADDIRRATGRSAEAPSPSELRTMSTTAVGGLPVLLALQGERTMAPTRVVLTGPGGGTFDIGPAATGDDDGSLLVADVVDYCRMVAQRVDPGDLAGTRRGDTALLDALLRAAQAIAV